MKNIGYAKKGDKEMKIIHIDGDAITFDNNKSITFDHDNDCGEINWADFEYLKEENGIFDFEFHEPLKFEFVKGAGFRFGNNSTMFFVPCYSSNNGHYTNEIVIY